MELIFFAVMAVVVVAVLMAQFAKHAHLAKALSSDPEVEVESSWLGMTIRTRPPLRPANMVASGGGKNSPPRWDITCEAPMLAGRTTLSLSREGVLGALREMLGLKDIHLGDPAFDQKFTLRGSVPQAVRSILSEPEVQDATFDLFSSQIWSVEVNSSGAVHCRAARDSDPAATRELLVKVVTFIDVLEAHAAKVAASGAVGDAW